MASRILRVVGLLAIVTLAGGGIYVYTNYRTYLFPPVVTASTAFMAPVSEAVYGTGTVEPERWARVIPFQRRRVIEMCRCEGQAVKAGQILARQDNTEESILLQEMQIR